jgi:hypothetical protein
VIALAPCSRIVFVVAGEPDRELMSSAADALRGVPRVRLEVATTLDGTRALLGAPGVALLLAHVRGAGDVPGTAELIQAANALAEPVKTVVMGDRGQTRAGLALLRAGAPTTWNGPSTSAGSPCWPTS